MYVCVCKGVTDCQIREAVCDGVCTIRELSARLGVATQCGRCAQHAHRMLIETLGTTAQRAEDDEAA